MAFLTIIKKHRNPKSGIDKGYDGQEWINLSTNTVFKCIDACSRIWRVEQGNTTGTELTSSGTLTVDQAGQYIGVNSGTDVDITVPADVFNPGDEMTFEQEGLGVITFVESGTSIQSFEDSKTTAGKGSVVTLRCKESNVFTLFGLLI